MKVDILQKGGDKKDIETIKNAVLYFGKVLMSTRMCNTLNIRIELRSTKLKKNTLGICTSENNGSKSSKSFTIIIQRELPLIDKIETVAHEMVHVYQQSINKLQIRKWKSDDLFHVRWDGKDKGVLESVPYMEQEWEKEAFALETPLLNCFREHHHKRVEGEDIRMKQFKLAVKKFDFENGKEANLVL